MADTKPALAQKSNNDIVAQVVDKIKSSDNILVALSNNPSVDEMAGAIGLTLLLDKIGKHATAIFSGQVPNVLEFLQPEKTFETNTNSLQDFIIALNKEKADHLRYKIDGDYVKVFITPYRTTINESDLEFSHGDYNVDLVVALNVATTADLDGALSEHGRIMHDASAIDIVAGAPGKFGDLEWGDPATSSVSEMVGVLAERLKDGDAVILDEHIATALLTGIVAATSRFSNEKTVPSTMVMASRLMEAGADQKLIASNIPVDLAMATATNATLGGDNEVAQKPVQDATSLSVDHGVEAKPVVETSAVDVPVSTATGVYGAIDFTPNVQTNGEQELEQIVQAPIASSVGGPLMDELRQQAGDDAVELGGLHDTEPKKDYGAMIEEELKTPIGGEVVAPTPVGEDNLAMQAAPEVAGAPEINGVPVINYAQAPEEVPMVTAPTNESFLNTSPGVVVAPVAVVEPVLATPVVVEASAVPVAEPVPVAPLPMPSEGILPPPPPPFDPSAVPVAPAATVATAVPVAPVMPEVVPIAPAAPVPEPTHTYLGANPAMADQVYPTEANDAGATDPGQFQLPGR